MAEFLVMPQATPTMEVGVVARWVAPEGAALKPQSVIAQVETDKATMDIEVFDACFLLKQLAAEGAEVPAGAPIAILGRTATEDISVLVAEYERGKGAAPAAAAAPPATTTASASSASSASSATSAPGTSGIPTASPTSRTSTPPVAAVERTNAGVVPTIRWMGRPVPDAIMEPLGVYTPPSPRVIVSPLARAIAADKGVRLASLTGSGPGGRIVAADVEAAARGPLPASVRPDTTVRATQMRKAIARRLTEAHQQVPVFYLTATFDAGAMVALKEGAAKRGVKISYNDLVLKAVATALVEVPECNASWQGDAIVRRGAVDLAVAVALPEGLITPVIRGADAKSVRAIAAEVRELAARAKEGKLAPEEYTGGSFSVSNLGMFDIDQFTAILNPPEAGILAVGSVLQVPVVDRGALAVGWRMKVTLTCDHRVIDGALGARFLQAVRALVELPALMVL